MGAAHPLPALYAATYPGLHKSGGLAGAGSGAAVGRRRPGGLVGAGPGRTRRSRSEGLSHPHPGEDTGAGVFARPRGSWTPSRACSDPVVTSGCDEQGSEGALRRAQGDAGGPAGSRPYPGTSAAVLGASAGSWRSRAGRAASGSRGPFASSLPVPGPGRGRAPPSSGRRGGAGPIRESSVRFIFAPGAQSAEGAQPGRFGFFGRRDSRFPPGTPLPRKEASSVSQPRGWGGL